MAQGQSPGVSSISAHQERVGQMVEYSQWYLPEHEGEVKMDRRNFMKMCGITLSGSVFTELATPASAFPHTRFYLNGELYRDFPKDFAREDEQGTEEFLTDSFKEHQECEERFGKQFDQAIAHESLGHGDNRVSRNWSGDALFLQKAGEVDFYYDDSDLALVDGKIWFVG